MSALSGASSLSMMHVRRALRVLMSVIVSWLVASLALAAAVVWTGTMDDAGPSDVIIVLGAALSRDGTPYKALTRRSAHAADVWKAGHAPVIICTGGVGPHVTRSEADGCREVLMRHGVPRDAIVLEERSRTTDENARFAKAIMDARGWRTAVVVSDSYHVFRARHLMARAGLDVRLSPVPTAQVGSPLFYLMSVIREVGALQVTWLTWPSAAAPPRP